MNWPRILPDGRSVTVLLGCGAVSARFAVWPVSGICSGGLCGDDMVSVRDLLIPDCRLTPKVRPFIKVQAYGKTWEPWECLITLAIPEHGR